MLNTRHCGTFFGLGCSTVEEIILETCHAIATHLLPQYVQISKGEKLKEIVAGFETCWGFAQVAGGLLMLPLYLYSVQIRVPPVIIKLKGILFHHASHGRFPWLV